jgi:PAS domain S-box-containing protein
VPTELDELVPLILDGISEGVMAVDDDLHITFLNTRAEQITGIQRDQALGRRCYEVLRTDICQSGCAMRRSIATGEPQRDVRVDIVDADMRTVPLLVNTAALRGPDGALLGGVEILRDISELEALRSELAGRTGFGDIIGVSPAMQRIFALLPQLAEVDAAVLIEGESGTGKELIARALHELSPRSERAFVEVNCGALPDALLESELFGYVRGAFTDARRDKPGRFQQADGGTLFLDEVGDLSPAFQVKLLRALQEGRVQRLGAVEPEQVDVRVVAATHRDLGELVRLGRFREDLYYRLRVIPLRVPPLRERRDDVLPLVEHHVARLATRTGRPITGIDHTAAEALVRYDFPGNVRELVNLLERAFVLCRGPEIQRGHLPELQPTGRPGPAPRPGSLKPSEHRLLDRSEGEDPRAVADLPEPARRLVEALNRTGWNRKATAEALGLSRTTLWRRMKDYGLA